MNTISKKIFHNVEMYPKKIAIVDRDGTRETTWVELLEVATKIAVHARRKGINGIIPIVQGRTMEYVASIMGLNMAGIAAVNLTDDYPEERVKYICEDVGATLCIDSAFVEEAMNVPIEPFEPCGDLSDIAMLLYTSGSTGTPKGVVFDNSCILQCIARNIKEMELDESVIFASTAMFSFAMFQFELLANLAAGATVHILSEDCRKNIMGMTEYFSKHQVTHAYVPYQIYKQMNKPLPFMKVIFLAGEKMSSMETRKYNTMVCYGLTETMTFATYFLLDKAYDTPPIGKSCDGMNVYLLDEDGNLCDEGEICVAGSISKGYWNRPALTAKTFVPNPFATGEHDKVLLHTGDIAKRLPNGNLLFLNRNDWMVKISGQRVEPGEIEAVMCRIPEIRQAVVKGFTNLYGQTYLCGFFTWNSPVLEEDIHTFLAKYLPAYMQPRYLVHLNTFPTNANGKLDRLSLKAPDTVAFQEEYTAPETPNEVLLCHAFGKVLHAQSVGVLDDFFRMGGDSLNVMELMIAAEPLCLNTENIFEGRTPRGIAKLLTTDARKYLDIYADCQEERVFYPLTSPQKIVLRTYLAEPDNTVFNLPAVYTFPVDIETERIQKALLEVFAHYPVLNVKLTQKEGIYGMVERPNIKLDIPLIDVKEEELPQKKQEFVVPFNPEIDLWIRAILYRTEKQVYLFWDVYHMIMDGTSLALFWEQFIRAYNEQPLIPEQLTQLHLSNYEQKYLQSDLLAEAKKFFGRKLSGRIFRSEPAFDHPEYGDSVQKSDAVMRRLTDPVLIDRLERFVETNNVTVATFFSGVFSYALHEITRNKHIYFLAVENGRHDFRLQHTMGQLIQHIPLVVSFEKETPFIERLQKLQADFIESWTYDCYPFELLESDYDVSPSIMHIYQGESIGGFHLSEHFISMETLKQKHNHRNVLVLVSKNGKNYEILIIYNAQAYNKRTMEKLVDTYIQTIKHFLNMFN